MKRSWKREKGWRGRGKNGEGQSKQEPGKRRKEGKAKQGQTKGKKKIKEYRKAKEQLGLGDVGEKFINI